MPPARGVKKPKEVDKSDHRVLANRYRVEKKLGSGNFGTAFLVFDMKAKKGDEENKVLKEIAVGELAPDETVDAVHEAKLLSRLKNPGIVKFHDSFLDGEFFCLITEFCEGGDLDERITKAKKQGKSFEQNQVMDWFVQLALAVDYMHGRRVLHRDLKTRNIFLKNNMCKIGDFGISRVLMGTTDMASTFTGTPYYMSPEVLKHEGYNSKSDVWSIACILYELCALEHAFEGQSLMGVMYKIVEGKIPKVPDKYDKNIQAVLEKVLTKDPSDRPSAAEILKMPFVNRHMEKMKNRMTEIREHRDVDAEDREQQQQQIYALTREKTHLQDLQEESLKRMTPRERMRLRKMREADEKAKELTHHTRANLAENIYRKAVLQGTMGSYNRPAWQGGRGEGHPFEHTGEGTVVYVQEGRYVDQYPDEEDDYSGTMLYEREDLGTVYQRQLEEMGTIQGQSDMSSTLQPGPSDFSATYTVHKGDSQLTSHSKVNGEDHSTAESAPTSYASYDDRPIRPATAPFGTGTYDDRPITPMKKTIDWNDPNIQNAVPPGLKPNKPRNQQPVKKEPQNKPTPKTQKPAAAKNLPKQPVARQPVARQPENKQVEEDLPVFGADPNDILKEIPEEIQIPEEILREVPADADAAETFYSQHEDFESEGDDDEDALIFAMQQALDHTSPAQDTVADGSLGIFSPTVRTSKIKSLRAECERKLGKKAFKQAYDYLKQARFGEGHGDQSVDEAKLMAGLKKFVKNPSDCFLIDQLLFLEYQANM
ncbi:serine/threonine-protein kinase Nek11-like isoform X2 [Ptychodera flava]|uniref:serine/threonine-protein kinase Nek11-like isoform X2 n=1 Tax=Ptychodera flava TaxID=63121 RepID=UPI00396A11AB